MNSLSQATSSVNGSNTVENLSSIAPKSVGRVDLATYPMPSEWWKTCFNENDLVSEPEVYENLDLAKKDLNSLISDKDIRDIFEKPGARILDLCCGTGRHSYVLGELYPHLQLNGLDQSPLYIQLGNDRMSKLNLTLPPKLQAGDCRKLPYPDASIDLVMVMGNSFGYILDADSDATMLREILRVLAPQGMLVLDVVNGALYQQHIDPFTWEWKDKFRYYCDERVLSHDKKRMTVRSFVADVRTGVLYEQFFFTRLYSKEEYIALLDTASSKTTDSNGNSTSSSTFVITSIEEMRETELYQAGLLEYRLLIKARKSTHTK